MFKRTFYQVALKFELARHEDCSGVVLGLPEAVWESWAHHLALPALIEADDHWELEHASYAYHSNSWIATLVAGSAPSSIQPLSLNKLIRVEANDLIRRAFDDVSEHIGQATLPLLRERAVQRVRQMVAGAREVV